MHKLLQGGFYRHGIPGECVLALKPLPELLGAEGGESGGGAEVAEFVGEEALEGGSHGHHFFSRGAAAARRRKRKDAGQKLNIRSILEKRRDFTANP